MSQRTARARARRRAQPAQSAQPQPLAAAPLVVARSWRLTPPLTLAVLLKLPLAARLRARAVCRAWRAALSRPELWEVLEVLTDSRYRESVTALRAASRLAGFRVRELRISTATFCSPSTLFQQRSNSISSRVLGVIKANAQSLRALRVVGDDSCSDVEDAMHVTPRAHTYAELTQLLQAAPALQRLEADAWCVSVEQALKMMLKTLPFRPLRVRRLYLSLSAAPCCPRDWQRLMAVMTDAPASFTQLYIHTAAWTWSSAAHTQCYMGGWALSADYLASLTTMAVTRQLPVLRLSSALYSAGQLVHWTRLVRDGALTELELSFRWAYSFDAAVPWQQLCDALRRCTSLKRLLCETLNVDAMCALLAALEGHASVETLHIAASADSSAVGAALARLVAANAPALRTLRITDTLTEEHTRPLLLALSRNTHLRKLECMYVFDGTSANPGRHLPDAFLEDEARPAVRANSSLLALKLLPPGAAALLREYSDAQRWREVQLRLWKKWCDDFLEGRIDVYDYYYEDEVHEPEYYFACVVDEDAFAWDFFNPDLFDAFARTVALLTDLEEEVRSRPHAATMQALYGRTERGNARAVQTAAQQLEQQRQAAIAAADAAMAALLAEEEAERAARPPPPPSRKSKHKKRGAGGGSGSGSAAAAAPSSEPQPGDAADDVSAASSAQHNHTAVIGAAEAGGSIDTGSSSAAASVSSGGSSGIPAETTQAAAPAAAASADAARREAPRRYAPPIGGASPLYYESAAPGAVAAPALPPLPLHFAALSLSTPPLLPPLPPPLPPLPPLPPPPPVPAPPDAPSGPPVAHCTSCACAMPALCAHCLCVMTPLPPPLAECCICFLRLPVAELRLLAPCGHRCVCGACAGALLAASRGCPICGVTVVYATRVFDL
jgi:hypothetical protein